MILFTRLWRTTSVSSKYTNAISSIFFRTLAASINEDSDTVMDVCEPYLLQQGFLDRSARGRKATKLAYSHLGLEMPENNANDKQEGIQRSLIDE